MHKLELPKRKQNGWQEKKKKQQKHHPQKVKQQTLNKFGKPETVHLAAVAGVYFGRQIISGGSAGRPTIEGLVDQLTAPLSG